MTRSDAPGLNLCSAAAVGSAMLSSPPAISSFRAHRRQRGPRRARGFTLIEIIMAFAVLAVGLGIAMQIATGAMRNSRQAAQRTEAALHAQSLLDIVGVGERLEEGATSGEFDDDYRWNLDVSRFEIESEETPGLEPAQAQVELYRLDLTVTWGPREAEREAHFVTLRALTPDPNG